MNWDLVAVPEGGTDAVTDQALFKSPIAVRGMCTCQTAEKCQARGLLAGKQESLPQVLRVLDQAIAPTIRDQVNLMPVYVTGASTHRHRSRQTHFTLLSLCAFAKACGNMGEFSERNVPYPALSACGMSAFASPGRSHRRAPCRCPRGSRYPLKPCQSGASRNSRRQVQ